MRNLIAKATREKAFDLIIISIIRLIVTAMGVFIPIKVSELITNIDYINIADSFLLMLIFLVYMIVNGLSSYFLVMTGKMITMSLRNDVWEKLLGWKVENFEGFLAGEVSNRILDNIESVSDFISGTLPDFVESLVMTLLMTIVLFRIDIWLTVTYLVSSLLIVFVMLPMSGRTQEIIENSQQSSAELSAIYVEATRNIRFVKAYTSEDAERDKAKKKMESWIQSIKKMQMYHSFFSSALGALTTAAIFFICGVGAYRFHIGAISMGSLVLFAFYIVDSLQPLEIVGNFFLEYNELEASVKTLDKMVKQNTECNGKDREIVIPDSDILKFKNVNFGYSKENILHNISFEVNKGEKLILVGENGGGKTTIFSLIERFFDIKSGNIMWGNSDITKFPIKNWRSKIGYAFQNYIISTGTIRENLQYGLNESINDFMLEEALSKVGLLDYVKKLPDGLDSKVGELGNNLSGGQKQRLALARLYLRNSDIILLDEATSQLDADSQKAIDLMIDKIAANKICIIIAHRLSTLRTADKVAVLKDGRIIDYGKHSELEKNCGYYQTLLNSGLLVGGEG